MNPFDELRNDVVAYVRRQLVGPFYGTGEVIADPPNRRYLMAVLFPREVEVADYQEQEGEQPELQEGDAGGEENLFRDEPVSAANDFLPASQGLSFFTSAPVVEIEATAGRYETLEGEDAEAAIAAAKGPVDDPTERLEQDPRHKRLKRWRRLPLGPSTIRVESSCSVDVLDGRATLMVTWRDFGGRALVTVTLVNAAKASPGALLGSLWDEMLLQVEFRVRAIDGEVLEYPSPDRVRAEDEEDELRLQHRAAKVYAIGHGCAPRWVDDGTGVVEVATDVMPVHLVPAVKATAFGGKCLDLDWLADESVSVPELRAELTAFVDAYGAFIVGEREFATRLERSRDRAAAGRIVERLERASVRMRRGVDLLASDSNTLRAFRLANVAMLRQMRHSRPDLAGSRHRRASAPAAPDTYPAGPAWRAFQLGFALLSLEGLAGDAPESGRDVVDLIWFPTGGGKTEAYLLLAAFEIFRRRLVHGSAGAGTAVLSRYTLTLLTIQQFQRTATTICACERIRAEHPDELGESPISIGLWVGEATTPNRYEKAREKFEQQRDANLTEDVFLLERCPWCGTEILPGEHSEDDGDYGVRATDTSFSFRCPSTTCHFHGRLPVHVVDDDLYENPPSFLLGTVDKFAGLAWEARAGLLFGRRSNRVPPTLVIQDELHLLTGPLGTTMGLYEAAIHQLCEYKGQLPKVIASTATIRRAPEQVMGLFGRPVDLFPPSGITTDESHFASVDPDRGRLYVGLMAQGHSADTATVHVLSALLQAPEDLNLIGPARDVYWTLVAYHSSLRELGRTVSLARDDVNARLNALIGDRKVREFDVEELTSNVERSLQPRLLERLDRAWDEPGSIDLLASTNMISVGVDISRLGLMLVNGQPKATAEYIQATSRVGRKDHPGLVFSLFRSTRPRDRSHYENFTPYHAALYRFVEPTSVTPFSPRSRDRSLHAALVILIRHHLGLCNDGDAGDIVQHRAAVDGYIDMLVSVAQNCEPREAARTRAELEEFRDDWLRRIDDAGQQNKILYYKPQGKGHVSLLRDFARAGDGWPTLRSMRNVDRESLVDVAKGQSRGGQA
jgi:hypothetical protein